MTRRFASHSNNATASIGNGYQQCLVPAALLDESIHVVRRRSQASYPSDSTAERAHLAPDTLRRRGFCLNPSISG